MTSIVRSVRNHNPGNLRWDGTAWAGLDFPPKDDKGYCRFTTAPFGFRALGRDLLTKYHRDDLHTVRHIITKFAPPSENNTEAYIRAACDMVGIEPDAVLILDERQLASLCRAIAFHEAGYWGFETADLMSGVALAIEAENA